MTRLLIITKRVKARRIELELIRRINIESLEKEIKAKPVTPKPVINGQRKDAVDVHGRKITREKIVEFLSGIKKYGLSVNTWIGLGWAYEDIDAVLTVLEQNHAVIPRKAGNAAQINP